MMKRRSRFIIAIIAILILITVIYFVYATSNNATELPTSTSSEQCEENVCPITFTTSLTLITKSGGS